jgi:hypothetical protein
LIVVAAGGWIVNGAAHGIALWRLLPLTGLLYLVHSAAALANVLAYDAVVAPGALARWFARAGAVVAASWGVAIGVLALPAYLSGRGNLVLLLAGVAVAMTVVVTIVNQLRSR